MKVSNSERESTPPHPEDKIIFWQNLNDPQQGKKYLFVALDSNNEETFLKTLHDIIDAIIWDIESKNRTYS